jgi:hypothetical protein
MRQTFGKSRVSIMPAVVEHLPRHPEVKGLSLAGMNFSQICILFSGVLLESCSDVNVTDNSRNTPLQDACKYNSEFCAAVLVKMLQL